MSDTCLELPIAAYPAPAGPQINPPEASYRRLLPLSSRLRPLSSNRLPSMPASASISGRFSNREWNLNRCQDRSELCQDRRMHFTSHLHHFRIAVCRRCSTSASAKPKKTISVFLRFLLMPPSNDSATFSFELTFTRYGFWHRKSSSNRRKSLPKPIVEPTSLSTSIPDRFLADFECPNRPPNRKMRAKTGQGQ